VWARAAVEGDEAAVRRPDELAEAGCLASKAQQVRCGGPLHIIDVEVIRPAMVRVDGIGEGMRVRGPGEGPHARVGEGRLSAPGHVDDDQAIIARQG